MSAGQVSATYTDVATMQTPPPKPSIKRPIHNEGIVSHIYGTHASAIIKFARKIVFILPKVIILSAKSAPIIKPKIPKLVITTSIVSDHPV